MFGVAGPVGRATASELSGAGWDVVGTGRGDAPPGFGGQFVRADRHASVADGLGAGADLVVDCLCYTAAHARQLLACAADIGSAVVLSARAVYVDDAGRHANSDEPPRFAGPVAETQPTMPPDLSGDYDTRAGYGANKVAAEHELLAGDLPVSVLRSSRVHGPGATRPQEWFVVRRLLDGRAAVPLARGGRTGDHPTAARNVARLVRACAASPATRVLNVADPDSPSAASVVAAVAEAVGRPLEIVGLPPDADVELGRNPWDAWPPFVLDVSAAAAVPGYEPLPYPVAVREAVGGLLASPPTGFDEWFDYSLDDRALVRRR
ncbi:NAD(P)H-binding protein [Jatrophihabitans fulvus]